MVDDHPDLDVQRHDDATVVRFRTQRLIDIDVIRRTFDPLIAAALDDTPQRVVLCMDNVEFLSSAALSKMIALDKAVRREHGRMAVCAVHPHVSPVFQKTHLDAVLTICDTLDAALNKVRD